MHIQIDVQVQTELGQSQTETLRGWRESSRRYVSRGVNEHSSFVEIRLGRSRNRSTHWQESACCAASRVGIVVLMLMKAVVSSFFDLECRPDKLVGWAR